MIDIIAIALVVMLPIEYVTLKHLITNYDLLRASIHYACSLSLVLLRYNWDENGIAGKPGQT